MSHEEMVLELLDCNDLSDWEYDFILGVAEFEYLSDKQREKIEDIYKEYFE